MEETKKVLAVRVFSLARMNDQSTFNIPVLVSLMCERMRLDLSIGCPIGTSVTRICGETED